MTLVRFNQHPAKTLNSIVDDFFGHKINKDFSFSDLFGTQAPVNISETKDAYALELVAPGLEKGDFRINLEDKVLTISSEKKTEHKEENEKQIRREFSVRSFSRSFTLDENVDAEKINAKYENGVLKIALPKKEAKQEAAKEITVA